MQTKVIKMLGSFYLLQKQKKYSPFVFHFLYVQEVQSSVHCESK